jgi:hypothetical protein
MARDDLAKAGLKLCDEVEELLSDGEIEDQALVPAAQLRKLMNKLAQLDADPSESQQAYEQMTDMLFGFLYNRDLAQAIRALWFVRLSLAEELSDGTLFESLLKSPPMVGIASRLPHISPERVRLANAIKGAQKEAKKFV